MSDLLSFFRFILKASRRLGKIKKRERLDSGIAGLAHPQMNPSHSRFTRRGVSPPYRKQNRQRMPPQMGRLLPLTIQTNPGYARVVFSLLKQGAYPQNCAMRNPSLPGQWMACPPAWRGNAQRINYKWMIPQYLGAVNYIILYLVFRKFFQNILGRVQKNGSCSLFII